MDAFFHVGIELAELGKHAKAVDIFDRILSRHADNVNIVYAKARSLAELGRYSESMHLLRQAISKNPKTIRSWAKEEKIFQKFHSSEQFRKLVKM